MIFSSVPAYSFGTKTSCDPKTTDKLSPPPGTYDIRSENILVPSTIFGQAPRPELFQKSDYPAPNHYVIRELSKSKSQKLPKPTHSKDTKDKSKIVPPGPGAYNPQKRPMAISHSMGNKVYALDSAPSNQKLGPGAYDPNFKSIHTSRSSVFGKTSRNFNYETGTPGPGAYEMPRSSALTSRFGTSERSKVKDEQFPGPGMYEIPRSLGGTVKSLTARRPIIGSKDQVPGPGAYDIKNMYTGQGHALGTGQRTNFIQPGDNPGPGQYEPDKPKLGQGKSIGKGRRPPLEVDKKTPGPGAYLASGVHGKEGPKITMQGRKADPPPNDYPGPGQYNPSVDYVRSNVTSVVIGTGVRNNQTKSKRNRIPGPGEYEAVRKQSAPIWSFTRDPRTKVVEDDEPGPGYYDVPPTIPDVPKYYFKLHGQI